MKTQHTPMPWSFVDTTMQTKEGIEVHRWFHAEGLPLPLTEANAAFIVRAVNSHEALLAALKRYMSFNGRYGEFGNYEEMDSTDIAVNLSILRKQANEAIAQAEGKE